MPVTVTNQNFSRIIFSGPNPVLLYFSSPENEISRRQDTILRLFAHEHPEIVIGRINTRKEPSLAAMYGIETIPSKSATTSSTGGLPLALQRASVTARP